MMEETDYFGRTAWHSLYKFKNEEMVEEFKLVVKKMIKLGVYILSVDNSGHTLAHLCVSTDNLYVLQTILDVLSEIEDQENFDFLIAFSDRAGATPLHLCASLNKPIIGQYLLSKGADKEAYDGRYRKPIDICKTHGFDCSWLM